MLALAACGQPSASGEFKPRHPGVLTVATSGLPVTGFWEGPPSDPTGGFEQQLAVRLAKHFDLASVKVIQRPFPDLVRGDLGDADLALAEITPTDEREKHLDFSTPYLASPPGVLVRKGTEIPDLNKARNLTWAVERNTTLADDLTDGVDPKRPALVTSTQNEAIDAVRGGQVDAAMLDLPEALALAQAEPSKLAVAAKFDSDHTLVAAFPEGSDNVEAVSSEIRALIADDTINDMAKRWLGADLSETGANDVLLLSRRQP